MKKMIDVKDVMEIMKVSRPTATSIIEKAGGEAVNVGDMRRKKWLIPLRLFSTHLHKVWTDARDKAGTEYNERQDRLDIVYRRLEGIDEVTK